ncbi:uncharacterized protein BX663DRAFT_553874 [Cokeromyces recurvatus]|uniref:uncharacterized protein n=1 Tax=Cokeromyces recurvatus TaxID=90255 RepID=UPI00222075F3|nr:uncharacterized protein BX663DRAFT_553874 [Cokeromyces recurvatus]KAI7900566.1 hypothetical protein BX663DRAFT_553874 [Cokeromyces recurvatus]
MKVICSICIENISDPVSLECGHVFDRECIELCFRSSTVSCCPYCKSHCRKDQIRRLYLSTDNEIATTTTRESKDTSSLLELLEKILPAFAEAQTMTQTLSQKVKLLHRLNKDLRQIINEKNDTIHKLNESKVADISQLKQEVRQQLSTIEGGIRFTDSPTEKITMEFDLNDQLLAIMKRRNETQSKYLTVINQFENRSNTLRQSSDLLPQGQNLKKLFKATYHELDEHYLSLERQLSSIKYDRSHVYSMTYKFNRLADILQHKAADQQHTEQHPYLIFSNLRSLFSNIL